MTDNPTTDIKAPKAGSKQAKLVAMLSRKNGVTVEAASQNLGWQRHTTSAAMTGLRKRGYKIERRAKDGKPSIYVIVEGVVRSTKLGGDTETLVA